MFAKRGSLLGLAGDPWLAALLAACGVLCLMWLLVAMVDPYRQEKNAISAMVEAARNYKAEVLPIQQPASVHGTAIQEKEKLWGMLIEPPPPPPPAPPTPPPQQDLNALIAAYRIIGISNTPQGMKILILDASQGNKRKSYKQGDKLGPFSIEEVSKEGALLKYTDGRTIQLMKR